MDRLQGHVAIITGAAGGIGAATARRFVEEGARVMLVDRAEAALADAAAPLGAHAAHCVADVSREDDTARYVSETLERFGQLDVVFANAGIEGAMQPLVELALDEWERIQAVNARGVFLAIKHAAPQLIARGRGSIIVTSSVAGLVGFPGLGAYAASKHALMGLVKTAALELGPKGVRVNSINPGPVDNRMMRSLEKQLAPADPAGAQRDFAAMTALRRYATNEDIADMALFLASAESASCNGSAFVVDGGFTAR